VIAWLAAAAFAGDLLARQEDPDIRIVARAIREQWNDAAIGTVYQTGGWLGGLGAVVPIRGALAVDIELSWRRITKDDVVFEIVPLTGLVELGMPTREDGSLTLWVAAGPAMAYFSERAAADPDGIAVTSGARICAEGRAGLRVDTGLVQPVMAPASQGPFEAIELELYVGRRSEWPNKKGFELGAWRLGVGLSMRI
jgi:hypothetical protein